MNTLKSVGLAAYYRMRRISKALRNWKKFGVIMFGSLFLAANLVPVAQAAANDLTYLYIDPAAISVQAGKTYQFSYHATDAQGHAVAITPAWSVAKSAAGTISSAGLFTASATAGTYTNAVKLSYGVVSVYAKVTVLANAGGNNSGDTPINPNDSGNTNGSVTQSKLTYLYADPAAISVERGHGYQFTPRAYDQNWQSMTVPFTWSMVKTAAGTVSATGLFTASQTKGTYENAVKLSSGALSTYARVVVYGDDVSNPPVSGLTYLTIDPAAISVEKGHSYQFTGHAFDKNWQPVTVPFTWNMGKTEAGTVDQNGNFTASQTIGTYENAVRLSSGNLSVYARVVVFNKDVPGVNKTCDIFRIDPQNAILHIDATHPLATQDLVIYAEDSTGDTNVVLTNVTWSPSNLVTGTGAKTARFATTQAGSYTVGVSANCNGQLKVDTASITVINTPDKIIDHVIITPANPTVLSGTTQQYHAIAYDTVGAVINPADVSFNWTLLGTGTNLGHLLNNTTEYVNFQSNTGLSGTYFNFIQVTATYKNLPATATAAITLYQLTVQQNLDHVIMTPDRPTIFTNDSTIVRAQAYDNLGAVINGCDYVWNQIGGPGTISSSANIQNITFSSQSLIGFGNLQVMATCPNYANTVRATGGVSIVSTPSNLRVELTPDPAYTTTNTDVYFTARAYDNNVEVTGSTSFSWVMLNSNAGYLTSQNGANAIVRSGNQLGTFGSAIQVTGNRNGMSGADTSTIIISSTTTTTDIGASLVGSLNGNNTSVCGDDMITYTLTLSNSNSIALTGVRVSMEIPNHTSLVSATSPWGSATVSGRTISWNVGTLGIGQTQVLTVKVTPSAGLTGTNVITANAQVMYDQRSGSLTVSTNPISLVCGGTPPRDGKGPLPSTGASWEMIVALMAGALTLTTITFVLMRRKAGNLI